MKVPTLTVMLLAVAASVSAGSAYEQLTKEAGEQAVAAAAAPTAAAMPVQPLSAPGADEDETNSGSYDPLDANRALISAMVKRAMDAGGVRLEGSLRTVKALGSSRTQRISCVLNGRAWPIEGADLFLTCDGREIQSIQIRNLDDNDGTYHRSRVRREGGVISVRTRMYHGGDSWGDYPVNAISAEFDSRTLAPLFVQVRTSENSHVGETKHYTLLPIDTK
jgi:hypothetical protein